MSCEANGVDLFYNYSPHINGFSVNVYEGGKWVENGSITFMETVYFNDGDLELQLKKIIDIVICFVFDTQAVHGFTELHRLLKRLGLIGRLLRIGCLPAWIQKRFARPPCRSVGWPLRKMTTWPTEPDTGL
jgi:hypothetical protein